MGNPNVGKSTLMNELVGEHLSTITSKAQTTRHRILGIVNHDDYQIVFSDTPGILKPHYELQKSMLGFVRAALSDADIIIYLTDVVENPTKNADFIEKINMMEIPLILVINKIDLSNQEKLEEMVAFWKETMPRAIIYPISALKKFNVQPLLNKVIELLPEGPAYYPKDTLTDKSERFFMEEMIREHILLLYQKEIPYSVQPVVEEFKEEGKLLRIRSTIYVNKDSQKAILIGKQGAMLKKLGTHARINAEKFFGKKIFLEMHIKVKKNWRDRTDMLKLFGY